MTDTSHKSQLRTTQSNTSPAVSTRAEVDAFLAKIKEASTTNLSGRLIFALDATASRQPTWDTACQLQAGMFQEAAVIGGLSVQLVYYRGDSECRSSHWVSQPAHLAGLMERIDCRMGHTQLGKVLAHAKRETARGKVAALVFVGDAMEENSDDLAHAAGELGRLGVRAFMFQEGNDAGVEQVFRGIARRTNGAYCRFDTGAADQLRELLRAVAAYAAGGMTALAARQDAGAIKLLEQMK
jgi:hypothetical protein